jgi:cytoskeletal protein RodZ
MSDLGALLRKARENRGYTLDDIQEITKIRKRYLEAIESGDYKVLPGSFYVRAFVKTYAETVGLDAEEVLRLYQKELPKVSEPYAPIEPMVTKRSRREHHNDRIGRVTVTLLMWLFPILIIAVIYIYFANNAERVPDEVKQKPITQETAAPELEETSPPARTGSVTEPSASPTGSPSPSVTPVKLTLVESQRNIRYIEVSPAGPHKLEIVITGRCWIEVKEGGPQGKSIFMKEIQDDEAPHTLSFDLTGPIYVNAGRADHVTISIGGTVYDDGDKAGSAKVVFMPADAQGI